MLRAHAALCGAATAAVPVSAPISRTVPVNTTYKKKNGEESYDTLTLATAIDGS